MELLEPKIPVATETAEEKLKAYLDNHGIKYTFITTKLDVHRSWLSHVFAGSWKLTEQKKKEIESIIPHFKF